MEHEEQSEAIFHQRRIQQTLANAREITAKMARALSDPSLASDRSSIVQNLQRQAVTLSQFQPPSSRTVSLVRDSRVGKSSLINSLLDLKDFARAYSNGEACTCVVTEYYYHDQDDFNISVEYFPVNNLERQFEELLQAYRDNESPPPGSSNQELEELEK